MTSSALTFAVGGSVTAVKAAKVGTQLPFAVGGTAATGQGTVRGVTSTLAFAVTIAIPGVAYNAVGWDEEYAPTELQWLRTCAKAHWDLTDDDLGIKGNELHDYGRHRSHRWLLGHGRADDYSIQDPRDRSPDRDVLAALDISLPPDLLAEACAALLAASHARTLPPQIAEWFGTVDGVHVVGWDVIDNAPATSDTSHLFHLHLGFFRAFTNLDHAAVLRLILGARVDDGTFNIALGRWMYLIGLAAAGTGALTVALLRSAQIDGLLREHDTLADVLAGSGTVEADFTGYARKTVTSGIAATVVDASNWVNATIPAQTWNPAGGAVNNTLVKLLACWSPTVGAPDSQVIPLTFHRFTTTTDGVTPLVWQPPTAGFGRAAG
jgi:hypothetical protein